MHIMTMVNCYVLSEFREQTLEVRQPPTAPISDSNMFVSVSSKAPCSQIGGSFPPLLGVGGEPAQK